MRLHHTGHLITVAVLFAACSGSSGSSPIAPSATTNQISTPLTFGSPQWVLIGQVRSSVTTHPVTNAQLTLTTPALGAVTAWDGVFRLKHPGNPGGEIPYVEFSREGFLTRKVSLPWLQTNITPWTNVATTQALTMIETLAPFNDTMWRDLIYGQFDSPDTLQSSYSRRLNNLNPNFYIRLGNEAGQRVVSDIDRDMIRKYVPKIVPQITGQPYTGRIEEGLTDRDEIGWITIEVQDIDQNFCGKAYVGRPNGRIILNRNQSKCPSHAAIWRCSSSDYVRTETLTHEIGHAFGLRHTRGRYDIMWPYAKATCDRWTFNDQEQYHANLAYQRPRYSQYPDSDPQSVVYQATTAGNSILVVN